ncbi:unnamed protein product [Paramecium sonneborni]|uniref:Uncharacterized protein n=1 Tax=Paramecium sonneborni TaxID=65129 RepID=A0A8S1REU8_9CILI|nr:unnamed protein product [Paramecium sonneborni]
MWNLYIWLYQSRVYDVTKPQQCQIICPDPTKLCSLDQTGTIKISSFCMEGQSKDLNNINCQKCEENCLSCGFYKSSAGNQYSTCDFCSVGQQLVITQKQVYKFLRVCSKI